MGIYCNIIITHIAIDVIYKSVIFSENNNNTADNNETEVPLCKASLNPSMQQHAMSEVSRSQSVVPCQRSSTAT
jgi:predicted glycosyltransferase